ncbi:MAG TPA: hypothetical protein DDY37_02975 [Legionella sp.]|nr:hypothetical protein [Legionella sp.]
MIHVNGFIHQQAMRILENNRYSLVLAVFFALLPYTTWLSLSIIALVTLRKGWREGALLLMPVMTAYFARSLASAPTIVAIVNTLLTYLPCYLVTCVLGRTASWRSVAAFFCILIACCVILLQALMPELIPAQFQYVSSAIREMHPDAFARFMDDTSGISQQVLANYLFGLQLVGLVFAATLPLALARAVQSQLYYPGGFKQEMHGLRSNKAGLLMLVVVFIAVSQNKVIAMNMLPLFVFYFLLAGLSLSAHALGKKKIRGTPLLLVTPILFVPFIMIPVYVILGSLDSLFNLRLYLPTNAGKTT